MDTTSQINSTGMPVWSLEEGLKKHLIKQKSSQDLEIWSNSMQIFFIKATSFFPIKFWCMINVVVRLWIINAWIKVDQGQALRSPKKQKLCSASGEFNCKMNCFFWESPVIFYDRYTDRNKDSRIVERFHCVTICLQNYFVI